MNTVESKRVKEKSMKWQRHAMERSGEDEVVSGVLAHKLQTESSTNLEEEKSFQSNQSRNEKIETKLKANKFRARLVD